MRRYYSSDKKKREDAKRKRKEEKRLKRQNKPGKGAPAENPATGSGSGGLQAPGDPMTGQGRREGTRAMGGKETMGLYFSGDQRMHLRMSRLLRDQQAARAIENWNRMAKILFWVDQGQGRHKELFRLKGGRFSEGVPVNESTSYGRDHRQYVLLLTLIVSLAERRTQDLYNATFAQRCNEISRAHGLPDDRYWDEGQEPSEWKSLAEDFDRQALEVLVGVLREYGQEKIAALVEGDGIEHFFGIMQGVRRQFLEVMKTWEPGSDEVSGLEGAIPEILQSSLVLRAQ